MMATMVTMLVVNIGPATAADHGQADEPGTTRILQSISIPFADLLDNETDAPSTWSIDAPDKTAVLETYTAAWCPPCGPADRAIARLAAERGFWPSATHGPGKEPTNETANQTSSQAANQTSSQATPEPPELTVLAYHPWPDVTGNDPFGIPEGNDRMQTRYDATWFPTTVVDGHHLDRPASRTNAVAFDAESIYHASYDQLVDAALAEPTTVSIHVEPTYDEATNSFTFATTVTTTEAISETLHLVGVIWQDGVHHIGGNGVNEHHMIVRDMLPATVHPNELTSVDLWRADLRWDADDAAPSDHGITLFVEIPPPATSRADGAHAFILGAGAVIVASTAILLYMGRKRQRGHEA